MKKYVRLVKGKRIALTFKIVIWNDFGSWETAVYEPYMRRRFFGLLPDQLVYRWVFTATRDFEYAWLRHLKPEQVERTAIRAVAAWEENKLAWEQHDAIRGQHG